MRTATHLIASCVALVLVLTSSCTRNEEQPAPGAGQSKGENIKALKETFLAKGYDKQFILPLNSQTKASWILHWDQASQTRTTESVTYVYVPLEAPAVAWVGVKKYLLIKRVGSELDFRLATYLFSEKQNIVWSPAKARSFFAVYTGELLLKHLTTGETFHYSYQRGVLQNNAVAASAKRKNNTDSSGSPVTPALAEGLSRATQGCYDNVICYWSADCNAGNTWTVVGTMTYGINSCPVPGNSPCSDDNEQAHWRHTETFRELVCPPTNPDPGPGPSDPGPGSPGPNPPIPTDPCIGTIVFNPSIAPSSPGNYRGGMYGYTRNGGRTLHDGIDIYAGPGSLVGAAHAGVVTRIRTRFNPGQYEVDSYGNFVEVRSEVNGVVIFLKYNHLDMVINGLTEGSVVTQDFVIGYSGTTGNASANWNIIPHVHIQAKDANYHRIDPAPYLATTFDPTTGQGTPRPCR